MLNSNDIVELGFETYGPISFAGFNGEVPKGIAFSIGQDCLASCITRCLFKNQMYRSPVDFSDNCDIPRFLQCLGLGGDGGFYMIDTHYIHGYPVNSDRQAKRQITDKVLFNQLGCQYLHFHEDRGTPEDFRGRLRWYFDNCSAAYKIGGNVLVCSPHYVDVHVIETIRSLRNGNTIIWGIGLSTPVEVVRKMLEQDKVVLCHNAVWADIPAVGARMSDAAWNLLNVRERTFV